MHTHKHHTHNLPTTIATHPNNKTIEITQGNPTNAWNDLIDECAPCNHEEPTQYPQLILLGSDESTNIHGNASTCALANTGANYQERAQNLLNHGYTKADDVHLTSDTPDMEYKGTAFTRTPEGLTPNHQDTIAQWWAIQHRETYLVQLISTDPADGERTVLNHISETIPLYSNPEGTVTDDLDFQVSTHLLENDPTDPDDWEFIYDYDEANL